MSLGSMIALIKTLAGSGGGGGGGTNVVANPTLAGTEADLTGLQVGDTKYKVGGGVMVVTKGMPPTFTLDKTWQEIFDASSSGIVLIKDTWEDGTTTELVVHVENQSGISGRYVVVAGGDENVEYTTDSASGYPAFSSPK